MSGSGRRSARPIDGAEAASLLSSSFEGASGVLLAVSGGPDSMALLGLAAGWSGRPPMAAATVDHGLRSGSAEEAALAARQSAALGLPHSVLNWTGLKPPSGLQEAAREARYALLADEARRLGFSHLATAHHADDQAETVLMRLAAGSGIAGLGGMRAQSRRDGVILARPLLAVGKERLLATCEALGLPFAQDPSNADPRFGRTRARAALETLVEDGVTTERLGRLAVRAARADEALALIAAAALEAAGLRRTDCVAQADWRALAEHPAEIRLRALGTLARSGEDRTAPQKLEKLEALLQAIDEASAQGLRLRRSIGDRVVTLQSNGRLIASPAPPRRKGDARSGTLLD